MRFPGKKRRAVENNRRGDIDFEDYVWETPRVEGWHPFVVLNAKDDQTSGGDPMLIIDFGVDLPDGPPFGRVRWHVPSTFPPKVEMLMSVLLPELADEEDDVDFDPKILRFRSCVGLLAIDHEYQRDDGELSWKVDKIMTTAEAEEAGVLAGDWQNERAQRDADASDAVDDDDDGLF